MTDTVKQTASSLPTLTGSLTRALFIGLLVAFIIMAGLTNMYGGHIMRSMTNERLNYIVTTQSDNMAQLLWDLEMDSIDTTLKNIVQDNNISGARLSEIIGGKKTVIASYNWQNPADENSLLSAGDGHTLTAPVRHTYDNGEIREVGILEIAVDYRNINAQIIRIMVLSGAILSALFIALGMMVYFILRRGIDPITRLSASLVGADYFTHKIVKTGDTREIHDLFETLADMQHIMQEQTLEIREQKAVLDTIIAKMPLGMFVEDVADGKTLVVTNDKFKALFGLGDIDCEGRRLEDLVSPRVTKIMRALHAAMAFEKSVVEIEAQAIGTDDKPFMAHIIKAPILNDQGDIIMTVGMVDDVTEQVQNRESLLAAKEAAEQANLTKSEFLANMSHELRTPMNSIIGLSNMIVEDNNLATEQKDMMQTVLKSSHLLLNIVNDILDLSKIEAGGVVLEAVPVDLHETVNSIVNTMRPLADEKSLTLTTLWNTDQHPTVLTDPVRFSRIMTNLVGNAIKFTEQGGINVIFDLADSEDGECINLTYRVQDTGIGIPENKLDHIFEKFSQADDSTTRRFGGTGLGLAITRQLVEMMHGTIAVSSTVGQGSTFTVTLPLPKAAPVDDDTDIIKSEIERHAESGQKIPIEKARVLIAEDHDLNQVLISKIFKRMGVMDYVIAEDGQMALEKFKSEPYDLIIMDYHMPNMNGNDATRAIRAYESEAGKPPVPIIAMTADAMVGTREKCLECGMDDYISKPVNAKLFTSILERWFQMPG